MFTVDYNSDEPIMLLNKQIGQSFNEDQSWDGIPYVDGAQFQEELLYLDTLGKKRIQVWINSPGGSIMQAMNIFSAILKSKTPVDTYNVGVCASAAGSVFMAGRKRIMSDYAQFMTHPPSMGEDDDKAYSAFKDSCVAMLSGKSDLSPELISYMMDVTTWIGAAECLEKGICTEIEVTKDSNKKRMPSADVKAMLAFSNNVLNQSLSNLKPIQMEFTKITNRLKLVDGANQDAIVSAINQLEEAKTTAETNAAEATNKLTEAEQKISDAEATVADLQNKLNAATAELETAKNATKEAEDAATDATATTAATEMVNSYKAKICKGDATDAEILTKWVNKAKVDLAGTKELLEAIPLNRAANRITDTAVNPKGKGYSVEAMMIEIKNRTATTAQ